MGNRNKGCLPDVKASMRRGTAGLYLLSTVKLLLTSYLKPYVQNVTPIFCTQNRDASLEIMLYEEWIENEVMLVKSIFKIILASCFLYTLIFNYIIDGFPGKRRLRRNIKPAS